MKSTPWTMNPPPATKNQLDECRLLSLPAELTTKIICHLPSLLDAFVLSQVSRKLQTLFIENITLIYNHVAARSLPCEYHARLLLIDQGGPPVNGTLSTHDVATLLRNCFKIERAIVQFEKEIVHKVRCRSPPSQNHDTN